jgi:hypothetical protein
MIPRNDFYDRLEHHCQPCSEWDGVCLRGHDLASPTGCPLRKFAPVQAASYDPDRGRVVQPRNQQGCSGCGAAIDADALPPITWPQVIANFAASMTNWIRAGMPLTDANEHGRRYGICTQCQSHFKGYYCKLCRCVCYIKTKPQTEYCPIGKW